MTPAKPHIGDVLIITASVVHLETDIAGRREIATAPIPERQAA